MLEINIFFKFFYIKIYFIYFAAATRLFRRFPGQNPKSEKVHFFGRFCICKKRFSLSFFFFFNPFFFSCASSFCLLLLSLSSLLCGVRVGVRIALHPSVTKTALLRFILQMVLYFYPTLILFRHFSTTTIFF